MEGGQRRERRARWAAVSSKSVSAPVFRSTTMMRVTEITGIDISEPMIAQARARAKSGRYPFVKELVVMDAHALTYADASFDCVVGQFVITLVEDPERVLSECARVVRAGGQIILVNHLYSERGLAAAVERLLAQKARALGLRPEFPFQRLADWAQEHGGAELIERRRLKPFGVYTLVRFRRAEPQYAAAEGDRKVNGAVTILKRGLATCRA
jgi:phosphatidylethanolamine/phosphatidyl-N-methylethanolamine N-methyltransferase